MTTTSTSTNTIMTIPAEQLEMGVPVNIALPLYKDYRMAWKLFPEGKTPAYPNGPGYTLEEFFASLMLRDGDGNEIKDGLQDVIERINQTSFLDKQFIVRTFIAASMIDQEAQTAAEALADNIYNPCETHYTIPAHLLPAQSVSITFVRPNNSVSVATNREYAGTKENRSLWEDLFFAHCVTKINNEPVPQNVDPLVALEGVELIDFQFAQALFLKMFTIADVKRNAATELGKSWRKQRLQRPTTVSSSSIDEPTAVVRSNKKTVV